MDLNKLANQQNICFVLPTYNEEGTIESVITQIKAVEKKQNIYNFSILVVDDNSSDQTQAIVKKVIDSGENIHLITGQKKGLGDAYKRGFLFALDTLDAAVIFQMDSDGQHEVSLIPEFLKEIKTGKDVVIGSRFIAGGSTPDFSLFRLLISRIGNLLVRYVGGVVNIKDCTSGYRAINSSFLRDLDFS